MHEVLLYVVSGSLFFCAGALLAIHERLKEIARALTTIASKFESFAEEYAPELSDDHVP